MFVLFKSLIVLMPWKLKRWMLVSFFDFQLDSSSYIGLSWIFPRKLIMGKGARIDHFTVAIHLDGLYLGENSRIGRKNWITGMSSKNQKYFVHQKDRRPELHIGKESAITKHHHLDCTNQITIGEFSIIGGYQSQLLTHSIDFYNNRQDSSPINIGNYCFVSTRSILLGGAGLPDYSILGAGSLLNQKFEESYKLYGGMPAKVIKQMPLDSKYFTREIGFVN